MSGTDPPGRVSVDVAIVGGGIAGSALAARLARAGCRVVVLERIAGWRWRASGVFSSPASVAALRRLGLDEATVSRVARPVPAMRVEPPDGPPFRLTYGDDGTLARSAVGFDRSALDPALLALAREAGADVRTGAPVTAVRAAAQGATTVVRDGDRERTIRACVLVGADGIHSTVARQLGVARRARLPPRVGLTFHLPDTEGDRAHDATISVLRDGYVGVAPVPGGRVNVGIVLGPSWRRALATRGAAAVAGTIAPGVPCDAIAGASPLGHRVTRRAGPGWLLVGDAAGFLDPFTGEGIHRALVSAELAAAAIVAHLGGRSAALDGYERAMRARFAAKDAVSWLVQAFLADRRLFGYAARRLAARHAVRETMGLVIGDLLPASRILDPRYLAALLWP